MISLRSTSAGNPDAAAMPFEAAAPATSPAKLFDVVA
jgi:hypothetical protein